MPSATQVREHSCVEGPILTLFTWPKSFGDRHIARIQRNAARSWVRLEPHPEILVFGDAPGGVEYCAEFGLKRVPDPMDVIDRTVRLRDMAAHAEAISDTPFYCFVNADIILTDSLMEGLKIVSARFERFLLGASPWNVNVTEDLTFGEGWEAALEQKARAENDPRPRACSDFFLYPKGYLASAPELLIGRAYVDNGLMWYVRKRRDALIDGTPGIFSFHQRHEYKHLGENAGKQGEAPGALWNIRAVGGRGHLFTWANATDHYTRHGIRPYWPGRLCRWSTHAVAGSRASSAFNSLVWSKAAAATRPVRKALGLVNPRA
jgi:hypothetical protein